ncbi:hypothetical protein AMTR_s00010p00177710 [Amborella trichopoda]|uniref:Uncharacterized protein n=1 Tax=Amborella trichopoda TaxID=13333 RepID=W1NEI9_AMBTC|nr:hypothetical protein AMTR_s00010p00177710 [Amborella trichopoda]
MKEAGPSPSPSPSQAEELLRNGYMRRWRNPLNFQCLRNSNERAQEMAAKSQATVKEKVGKKLKDFKVFRWNPEKPERPYLQSFHLDLNQCGPMVLYSKHGYFPFWREMK